MIVNSNQENHKHKEVLDELLNKFIELHYFEIQEFYIAPNDQDAIIVFGNTDMPHDEYAYGEQNRSIWKCNLQSGNVTKLTLPDEDAHAPCWSPNGEKIAYISRASGKKELWCMNHNGTNKQQLTFSEYPGQDPFKGTNIKWSPDGSLIAYSVNPNGSVYGLWQTLKREQEKEANIQVENGEDKQKLLFQQARSTFKSSLYIYNLETGINIPIVSYDEHSSFIIDWYPDNRNLLVISGSDLQKINIETNKSEKLYTGNYGLIKRLEKNLLSARRTDTHIEVGSIHEKEFIKKLDVEIVGNEPIILHTWSYDGSKLYFTSQEGVSNILYSIEVNTGEVKALTEEGKVVWDIPTCPAKVQGYHQKDAILFPYSGPQEPMELWELESGGMSMKISNITRTLTPLDLPKVELIQFESNGWEIESILVLPKNYESTKKYPTIIYLHGGPEDNVKANFTELISGRAQSAAHFLAEQGYPVLLPNFRGSNGYGEAFKYELANYKIMQNPYEDVMAGVDYLIKEGIAEPEKLGIYGSSFGATLTAWTISQTTRFKGAIGAVGIYDQLQRARYTNHAFHSITKNRSKGTKPNDFWFNPEVYKHISPMEHIEKVNTPILFIETGAERMLNGSCAKPFYNGLLTRGIKTNLVYYPEAFHNGGWNDVYKRDYMKRLIAWFDYCIKEEPLPDEFLK
jgi:dipeptidyl aminopeptidase/acylaminoacyl peptidase